MVRYRREGVGYLGRVDAWRSFVVVDGRRPLQCGHSNYQTPSYFSKHSIPISRRLLKNSIARLFLWVQFHLPSLLPLNFLYPQDILRTWK